MGDKKEFYTNDGKKITIEDAGSTGDGCAGILAMLTIGLFLILLLFFVSPIIAAVVLLFLLFSNGWSKENQIFIIAWVALTLIVPTVYYLNISTFQGYFGWLEVVIQFYYPLAGIGVVGSILMLVIKAMDSSIIDEANPKITDVNQITSNNKNENENELESGSQDVENLFGGR